MPKFSNNDFPENPDWGIERKFLDVPNDASYRKNYGQTNFARAFATAQAQKLPDDLCLAVAACVTEGANGIQQGYNYLMTEMNITVKPVEGLPSGMAVDPSIELTVNFGNVTKRFTAADVMHYHIPSMTKRELNRDGGVPLPEALWHMSTHPEAGGSKAIQFDRMHVSTGGFLGETKPTRVVGLHMKPMDEERYNPMVLATFPIERLGLTDNERTLLNEAGDDGFALVMKQRRDGKTTDGKSREQLIKDVRGYRSEVATARQARELQDRRAEGGRQIAEEALRPQQPAKPDTMLGRLGKMWRGK